MGQMLVNSGAVLDEVPEFSARAMTCKALRDRLHEAHAAIGNEGRFALTFTVRPDGAEDVYLTHWRRPSPEAFEDCKSVAMGSLSDVLSALERYVSEYRRQPTTEEVGRTLGILAAAE